MYLERVLATHLLGLLQLGILHASNLKTLTAATQTSAIAHAVFHLRSQSLPVMVGAKKFGRKPVATHRDY